jgi:hypothetical protein
VGPWLRDQGRIKVSSDVERPHRGSRLQLNDEIFLDGVKWDFFVDYFLSYPFINFNFGIEK